jgi:lipopolysaccharide transport system ATP-binding protein
MPDIPIRVEKLGKKYILGHRSRAGYKNYTALRDVLTEAATAPFRRIARRFKSPNRNGVGETEDFALNRREEFWALRDVSFEIKRGESVGIIGRNGAGKSTLLKLLSRITAPTEGRIELEGKVASLLEVGTGFHPELTGRENIYLNGAIMGMKRAEIRTKFDEIVAFAEVEKFLDTPVKHFSSGMYVRLAFAIAAHLDPEILIIDEVLAVGDMQFQKKCLTKMEDVTGREGKTILFVSHNMDLITKLCSKALLLTAGRAGALEPVDVVTSQYLNQANSVSTEFVPDDPKRSLRSLVLDPSALLKGRLVLKIRFKFTSKVSDPVFGIVIYTEGGTPITGSNSAYHPPSYKPDKITEGEATVTYDDLPFWSGRYSISVWLNDGLVTVDHEANALTFEYVSPTTPLNAPDPRYIGSVHLIAEWMINV